MNNGWKNVSHGPSHENCLISAKDNKVPVVFLDEKTGDRLSVLIDELTLVDRPEVCRYHIKGIVVKTNKPIEMYYTLNTLHGLYFIPE